MNISLINYRSSSVSLTTYAPYVALIDVTNQVITVRKEANTFSQPFSLNAEISINKEMSAQSIKVTAKII